jgi:hypothetical protein
MNNFLESCIDDLNFNENKVKYLNFDVYNTNMLLSFPRSGNGWVRVILSTLFAIDRDAYFNINDLDSLTTLPLINDEGVKTSILGYRNEIGIPIDTYVPDIYQYEKTVSQLKKSTDGSFLNVSPKNVFKTHHLDSEVTNLQSYGIIIREPKTCVLSAALLLEENLLQRPQDQINFCVEYYLDAYIKYLEKYLEINKKGKAYFIFQSEPEIGLSKWVNNEIYKKSGDRLVVEQLIKRIVAHFPLKTTFNKDILDVVKIEEFNQFDKAEHLYAIINSLQE